MLSDVLFYRGHLDTLGGWQVEFYMLVIVMSCYISIIDRDML